jgi:hypothetical protein
VEDNNPSELALLFSCTKKRTGMAADQVLIAQARAGVMFWCNYLQYALQV